MIRLLLVRGLDGITSCLYYRGTWCVRVHDIEPVARWVRDGGEEAEVVIRQLVVVVPVEAAMLRGRGGCRGRDASSERAEVPFFSSSTLAVPGS